jgi:hypothetical protein
LKDWGADKKLFYDRHVLHLGTGHFNPAYAWGSLMDYLLSGREDLFEANKHKLVFAQIESIKRIARAVRKSKLFKCLSRHKTQQIYFYKEIIGIFTGLAGIPDYILVENDMADIVDLKTTSASCHIDFFYHCTKYKYYFQQAFYQILVNLINPKITKFRSRLFVVYKRHKIPKFEFIELEQKKIEEEKKKIWQYIEELRNEMKFGRYEKTWDL